MVERRRQQEVAERQRALDAQKAKAEANPEAANDDQDEDNFDLREVNTNGKLTHFFRSYKSSFSILFL